MTDQPDLSPELVEEMARRIGMDTITETRGLYTRTRSNPDALKEATMLRALRTALTASEARNGPTSMPTPCSLPGSGKNE